MKKIILITIFAVLSAPVTSFAKKEKTAKSNANGTITINTWKKGRNVKKETYNEQGNLQQVSTFRKGGRLKKAVRFDANGNKSKECFDKDGKTIKCGLFR